MKNGDYIALGLLAAAVAAGVYAWNRRDLPAPSDSVPDLSDGTSAAVATDNGALFGLTSLAQFGAAIGVSVPLGARLHNWGNLRYLPAGRAWNGQTAVDHGGFGEYETDELGCRAMGKQLMQYFNRGLTSVEQIIATYAPPNENKTNAYTDKVAQDLQVLWNEPLRLPVRLGELMYSMVEVEQGYCPFSIEQLQAWGTES